MRVTIKAGEERKHGVENSRVCRGGGLRIEVDGSSALIHDGRILEDAGGGRHGDVPTETAAGKSDIGWLLACMVEKGFLVGLDDGLNIDLSGRRLGGGNVVANRGDGGGGWSEQA